MDNQSKLLLNMFTVIFITQLVSQPTRITDTSSSLIDHLYLLHSENVRLVCLLVS